MTGATTMLNAMLKLTTGLTEYRELMELYRQSKDISTDEVFKRRFTYFYRVRREKAWRDVFYRIFEDVRSGRRKADFRAIVTDLRKKDPKHRVEASFVSKMLATLDDSLPIIDYFVLKTTQLGQIGGAGEKKIDLAVQKYEALKEWAALYLASKAGKANLKIFNKTLGKYARGVSDMKKLDFLLWGEMVEVTDD